MASSCDKCMKASTFSWFVWAFICSYSRFHDLVWALVAGVWGYLYVPYFFLRYYVLHWFGVTHG